MYRRNAPDSQKPSCRLAMHVGMDQVSMHYIRAESADLAKQRREQERIEIGTRRDDDGLDPGVMQPPHEPVCRSGRRDAHAQRHASLD
jgi:hypothetical protein